MKDLAFYYDDKQMIGNRSEPDKNRVQARKVLQDELRNMLLPLKGNRSC